MLIEDVNRLNFDEKVLGCPKPALVYFTCSVFCSGIMGEKARKRFQFVFVDVARGCKDVQCFEMDYANVGVGQFFHGISNYKGLPSVVLFSGGLEIARKAISFYDAKAKDAAAQCTAWVRQHLPATDSQETRSPN